MNVIERLKALSTPSNNSSPFLEHRHVALLFINSYQGTDFSLGDGPCNDGLLCKECFEEMGYQCYLYFDISVKEFYQIFDSFLCTPFEKLVVYFSGHGMYVKDRNHDEADGRDEALVFKDGAAVDDDLIRFIHNSRVNKLFLLSDCCHSGSIFDVVDEKNVVAISAASDDETAKQTVLEHKGQGVFTYYFWKLIKKADFDFMKLQPLLNAKLVKYHQHCVVSGGNKEMKL